MPHLSKTMQTIRVKLLRIQKSKQLNWVYLSYFFQNEADKSEEAASDFQNEADKMAAPASKSKNEADISRKIGERTKKDL